MSGFYDILAILIGSNGTHEIEYFRTTLEDESKKMTVADQSVRQLVVSEPGIKIATANHPTSQPSVSEFGMNIKVGDK